MATTTTLTVFEPGNSTGSLHVQFSLYGSTPDSGAVESGMGDWYVVRGGSVIHRWRGLVGGWATLEDGDIVYAKYTDGAGVSGSFASYTFTLASTWDGTLYVDGGGGSDSNDGLSIGAPKLTWNSAYAAYTSARSAGEKWRILLKCGESYDETGLATANWLVLGSTTGHLHVGSYDTGVKPALSAPSSGNGSTFISAQFGAMSLTVAGITFDGTSSAGSNYFCNAQGTPITASTEANVCIIDCDITRVNNVYVGPYATGYDPARIDFHAWVGNTVDDFANNAGHFYGNLANAAHVLMMGSESSGQNGANGFARARGYRYTAFINNVWDRATGFDMNVFRISGGGGSVDDDRTYRCLIYGDQFLGCNEAIEMEVVPDPIACKFRDIDIIGCYFTQDAGVNYPISWGGGGDANSSIEMVRCRMLCNQSNSDWLGLCGIPLQGGTTDTGHVESVLWANNTCTIRGNGGIGCIVNMIVISSSTIDAGSLTFYGNYCVTTGTGTDQRVLGSMTSSWVAASDYNHIVTAGGSIEWTNGVSVATWQGLGFDTNGTTSTGGTHNLTDLTYAAFDATPASGTGPQIGTGGGTVFIDAAGNLFVDDAGAFEYGGSAPTAPSAGGVDVTPTTAALVITGYAPTVTAPADVTPTTAALVITGYAPTVTNGEAAASSYPGRPGLSLSLRLGL